MSIEAKVVKDVVKIEITLPRRDLEDLPGALGVALTLFEERTKNGTNAQQETATAQRELLAELHEAVRGLA